MGADGVFERIRKYDVPGALAKAALLKTELAGFKVEANATELRAVLEAANAYWTEFLAAALNPAHACGNLGFVGGGAHHAELRS